MAESATLLLEIGTEELPPKALPRLRDSLVANMLAGLERAGLSFDANGARGFATPRRLAVLIPEVPARTPDTTVEHRGPPVSAAFDAAGKPTRAAEGFARKCGVSVEELHRDDTGKGERLAYTQQCAGRPLEEAASAIIADALKKLPIPRPMRWGTADVEFVRPVHWVVLLHDKKIVKATVLGLDAGRETFGHRFLAPGPFSLKSADDYEGLLRKKGRVVADFAERRDMVRAGAQQLAADNGGEAVIRSGLLDEVTALVEWPVPVLGRFDETFLALPAEVLMSAMERHQKAFPLRDLGGDLLPMFVGISNLESKQPDVVRVGYEKVMRPRLADATFFWEQDRKTRLDARVDELRGVIFQRKLGSLHDKAGRLQRLAGEIARALGSDGGDALRAAELCKTDLLTGMVGEFPELQGVMGRYYALNDGEHEAVARAIDEHYMPRFGGDGIPKTETGQILAIADKLDTLVGIFAAGLAPKGDKDPFALRRTALGVMRILIEAQLDLDLEELLNEAAEGLRARIDVEPELIAQVFDFMMERLRRYCLDADIPVDVFEAVLARRPTRPLDFHRRLQAVAAFKSLEACESLAAANKRVRNILLQADERGIRVPDAPSDKLLEEAAEKTLSAAVNAMASDITALVERADYNDALTRLATLRESVDAFFDDVMVMADDEKLRDNRLALLARMHRLFLGIADVSQLQH
jgi:glycyl-tRNA synthetase beta chain